MSDGPRVLHAPVEIAGQASLSAFGLRELGVDSSAFARTHAFDYAIGPDIVPGPSRAAWLRAALAATRRHDVVHFYFAQSFVPEWMRGIDARALRRSGRRVVVEFLGRDVRMPSVEAARNPSYVRVEGEDDEVAAARMSRWSSITGGHAILCDRAMTVFAERFFDHVHVVPFRIDTQAFVPSPPSRDGGRPPVVVHAPSDRAGKGTRHVRSAIESLEARGAELEYVEVHGVSQQAAVEACRRADIVVDQLCSGAHGVFAVEAMSMAKPVVCNVLPEVEPQYPDGFPIINASPATVADVLADWIERPGDRHELGLASRAYAERVHDVRVVARRLLEVYAQLPGRSRSVPPR